MLSIFAAACKKAWESYPKRLPPPKITFIATGMCRQKYYRKYFLMGTSGKRHHVRFFPRNSAWVSLLPFVISLTVCSEGDRSGNCHAGLVVDSGLQNPIRQDFFIQFVIFDVVYISTAFNSIMTGHMEDCLVHRGQPIILFFAMTTLQMTSTSKYYFLE